MSTILERLEPQVREALEMQQLTSLQAILAEQHPADIAQVLERLDGDDQFKVFQLLTPKTRRPKCWTKWVLNQPAIY